MAGSVSTTSSHTLTHAPDISSNNSSSHLDLSRTSGAFVMSTALLEALQSGNRHGFLQPNTAVPNASLQLVKSTLDSYAGQLSDEQQQRLKEANKKRKRADAAPKNDVLKIRKLHIEGFESSQIWQQARRIISSALEDSQDALEDLQLADQIESDGVDGEQSSDEELSGEDLEDEELDGLSEEDVSGSDEDIEEDEEEVSFDEAGMMDDMEDDDEVELDGEEYEFDEEEGDEEDEEDEEEAEPLVEDPNGLNDGFFSIDDFNKQTQWFENQDARADPNTDAASDDEDEVDWHGDPFATKPGSKGAKSKKSEDDDGLPEDEEDDDDEEDEAGPTFGNMDLDAPEGESDEEAMDDMDDDDMDDGLNANDVFYKDFFAPPAKKGKDGKPRKPRQPKYSEPNDAEVETAMATARRDLFEDESEHDDSEDALSEVDAGDPKARRSAHERKQAKLAEEIRRLEAANVGEKKWVLSGEASAADRPKHSLLDEDLDYEHAGKPVPVITAEISESIEDMIKRRIIAQEFDEVIRRRPDSLDPNANRRGLVELDDTKNKQSLAEIYEEEHIKNTNPDTYVSKADEKARKEEKELEQMWKEICGKLDSLSSWHYKPKPVAPSLTVVADVATVSMEDAQPATAQGVSGGDQTLAPQEIYKAGKDNAEKGEIVAKSGLPVARQELSRDEKARRHRREKERIRKAGGNDRKPLGGRAQSKKDTIADLKKGGVRVINKKGEVLDMEGNKARDAQALSSGNFKL
ncbi:U3 small nucleolar ribonucleoprotein Mpp10 [Apiospora arundinis]|uniref:U3 small nucleolar ribonucleoprotein protein MPP10 n=1 Tax=Apiospora arundinis TaxID=335852 RepID=A0ABR2IHN0_9PEZI